VDGPTALNAPGRAFIGISGWRYASWRGDFYPKGLPQRRELEYAAGLMDSIELNGSFYSLQRPSSYEAWRDQTPDDFVFAVKGGRFITHMRRMRGIDAALGNFLGSGMLAFGSKLGPILWQLPARETFDAEVLDDFLGRLPRSAAEADKAAEQHDDKLKHEPVLSRGSDLVLRHAIEARSEGFASQEALEILRRHQVALVVSDGAGDWPMLRETTADFEYLRLHGADELYASGYTDDQLDAWASEIRAHLLAGRDVYAYFDNDARGHAPHDAVRLRARLTGFTARIQA
jgi:uncharacterized protein YecE (DUF72 family)